MPTEATTQPGPEDFLQVMNRAMKADDSDGLPKTGMIADHLGAVIGGVGSTDCDLVAVQGRVCPQQGGMSVFLGEAQKVRKMMSKARWPAALGGLSENLLYQMHAAAVSESLRLVRDEPERFRKKTHAVLEPGADCPTAAYEAALYATRPHWQPYVQEHER